MGSAAEYDDGGENHWTLGQINRTHPIWTTGRKQTEKQQTEPQRPAG